MSDPAVALMMLLLTFVLGMWVGVEVMWWMVRKYDEEQP